jgi:hypothetical protein
VLLVLANQYDRSADDLVATWNRADVMVMRPADLSAGGWRYTPGDVRGGRFTVAGRSVPVADVDGVLTRMACVFEADLGHIIPADRAYVAAEMTAVLLAWLTELSELSVPVLNRPTATCLCGPLWPAERWLGAAAALGHSVVPAVRAVRLGCTPESSPPATAGFAATATRPLTVVNGICFGAPSTRCADTALRLARLAGCRLLTVHVANTRTGHAICGADPWPDLSDPAVAGAVLRVLDGGSGAGVGQ